MLDKTISCYLSNKELISEQGFWRGIEVQFPMSKPQLNTALAEIWVNEPNTETVYMHHFDSPFEYLNKFELPDATIERINYLSYLLQEMTKFDDLSENKIYENTYSQSLFSALIQRHITESEIVIPFSLFIKAALDSEYYAVIPDTRFNLMVGSITKPPITNPDRVMTISEDLSYKSFPDGEFFDAGYLYKFSNEKDHTIALDDYRYPDWYVPICQTEPPEKTKPQRRDLQDGR